MLSATDGDGRRGRGESIGAGRGADRGGASYERMTGREPRWRKMAMDGRSPFGPNAPSANDLTPDRPLVNRRRRPDGVEPDGDAGQPQRSGQPRRSVEPTKIPPMRAPDAGPPPGTTTTNPDTTTETTAPATARPAHAQHDRAGHHASPAPHRHGQTGHDAEHDHTRRGRRRGALGRDALAQDEPDRAAGERARSRRARPRLCRAQAQAQATRASHAAPS